MADDGWHNEDAVVDTAMADGGEAGFGSGGGGNECHNCGQEGHIARECPEPRKGGGGGGGACFNCGQEGHMKSECPNPSVFTGTCRYCQKEGHRASECPEKPAEACTNCQQEGHKAFDCKANRKLDRDGIAEKSSEQAWNDLKKADLGRDLDDVREAIEVYVKSEPDTTWAQLETGFRNQNFGTYIIAYEKEITDTFTLINLQGKLDCKYYVGLFFSAKPQRGLMKDGWPETPEQNLERLLDAGLPMDRGIPKCSNCERGLGHTAKACSEERVERSDVVEVKCVNCEEVGHRARDCTQPRKDRFACRNCGGSGHQAAECTEPRSAVNVECKHCGEKGHFVKDCPTREPETCRKCGEEGHRGKDCTNPPNLDLIVCRNCDEKGHVSKECPKKRDYSRVKCLNCDQMGHTKTRCKEPIKEETGDDVPASSAANDGMLEEGKKPGVFSREPDLFSCWEST